MSFSPSSVDNGVERASVFLSLSLDTPNPAGIFACVLWEGQFRFSFYWLRAKKYSVYHEHGTRHEVSYLIHYEILLKYATEAYYKMR